MGGNDDVVDIKLNIEPEEYSLKETRDKIAKMLDSASHLSNQNKKVQLLDNLLIDLGKTEAKILDLEREIDTLSKSKVEIDFQKTEDELTRIYQRLDEINDFRDAFPDIQSKLNAELKQTDVAIEEINKRLSEEKAKYESLLSSVNGVAEAADKATRKKISNSKFELEYLERAKEGYTERRASIQRELADNKSILASEREEEAELVRKSKLLQEENNRLEELRHNEQYVKKDEDERKQKISELSAARSEEVKELKRQADIIERSLKLEDSKKAVIDKTIDPLKQQKAELQAQIRAEQENIKEAKNTTAQYYYRLRSLKMLSRYFGIIGRAADDFGKKSISALNGIINTYAKFISGFGIFRKGISLVVSGLNKTNKKLGGTVKNFDKVSKSINKTTIAHNNFGKSIGNVIKLLLKYTLGIRSFYVLFNRLRSALMDGMQNLATQFSDVNADMSSLVTSLFQMKNAVAAAVQPLLSVLVPVMEKVSAVFSDVSYKVASFIASFTGQEYVYKAKRVQQEYVKSLEDTADAADEAKGQLQSYDKLLNVTTQETKEDGKNNALDMFDEVPIDNKIKGIADKLKDLLKKLFKPLLDAWNKEGKFVMDAWKYALQEIWKLLKDIARDFWRVWNEPETTRIFENLLHVIGDIGLIVGNLARNFREAWNVNENGYRILRAIRDVILIITEGLREAADYTVKWSDALTFIPLMNALADMMELKLVPAVQKVVDLAVYLYEVVFLELLRYMIEELMPILIETFGFIVESIGNIAENLRLALKEGELGERIVKTFEDIITLIAKGLRDCAEYTAQWSKELNFRPVFEQFLALLEKIKTATSQIVELVKYLYTQILLKIIKDFIEVGLPRIEEIAGHLVGIIGNIAENLQKALVSGDRGVKIVDNIERLFERVGNTVLNIVKYTEDWSKALDFGPVVEEILKFTEDMQDPIQNILDMLEYIWTSILLPVVEYFIETALPNIIEFVGLIGQTIGTIVGKLKEALEEGNRGSVLLGDIKNIVEIVGGAILRCAEYTAEWAKNLEFGPLLDAIDSFLVKAQPAIKFISGTLETLWKDVMLPFYQYLIEEGLPKLLDTVGKIMDKIDWDKLKEKTDAFLISFEGFLEKGIDAFAIVLGDLGDALAKFLNSDIFDRIVDTFIRWMNDANPEDMAKGLEKFVIHFLEFKAALLTGTMLAGLKEFVMTLINWHNNSAMVTTMKNSGDAIKDIKLALDGLPDKLNATKSASDNLDMSLVHMIEDCYGVNHSISGIPVAAESAAALSVPQIALIAAAIATISAAVITLWKTNEEFKAEITTMWDEFIAKLNEDAQIIVDSINSLGFNFQSFVELLKALWLGFCNFIAPVLEGAFTVLMEKLSGVADYFTGWIQIITGVISGNFDQVIAGMELRQQGWSEFTSANISGIAETISQYAEAISTDTLFKSQTTTDGVLENMDTLNVGMSDSMGEIQENTNTTLDEIQLYTLDSVDSTHSNTLSKMDAFNSTSKSKMDVLNSNVKGTLTTLESNTQNSANKIYNTSTQSTNKTTSDVSNIVDNFNSRTINEADKTRVKIDGQLTTLNSNVRTQSDKLISTGNSTKQQVITIGEETGAGWIEKLTSGFTQGSELSMVILKSFIKAVKTLFAVASPSKVFMEIGTNVSLGLFNGAIETFGQYEPSYLDMCEGIVLSAGDILSFDAFFDIGYYAIAGLTAGILDQLEEALEAARALAEEIYQTVCDALDIASPSKLMKEVGGYFDEGLALGIKDSAKGVINQTKSMISSVLETVDTGTEDIRNMTITVTFDFQQSLKQLNSIVDKMQQIAWIYEKINKHVKYVDNTYYDVVSGKYISTRQLIEYYGSEEISADEMYNIVNDAVYSALKNANDSKFFDYGDNSGFDSKLGINGRELANVLRQQNEAYKKSTGRSMF